MVEIARVWEQNFQVYGARKVWRRLLPLPKFQAILIDRYPFILIDEYQDTNAEIIEASLQVRVDALLHLSEK